MIFAFLLLQDHEIDHLTIPTRDYCFAPLLSDICLAVNFIHSTRLLLNSFSFHPLVAHFYFIA